MTRLRGRAKRCKRCRAAIPHGHWKTTTFTGALRRSGMTAPMMLDGPMNGAAFLAYVEPGARSNAQARRCRRHGQSARPQEHAHSCCHPSNGRDPALPAAVLSRLQPDREPRHGAAPHGASDHAVGFPTHVPRPSPDVRALSGVTLAASNCRKISSVSPVSQPPSCPSRTKPTPKSARTQRACRGNQVDMCRG
jgi:hypothetical protein